MTAPERIPQATLDEGRRLLDAVGSERWSRSGDTVHESKSRASLDGGSLTIAYTQNANREATAALIVWLRNHASNLLDEVQRERDRADTAERYVDQHGRLRGTDYCIGIGWDDLTHVDACDCDPEDDDDESIDPRCIGITDTRVALFKDHGSVGDIMVGYLTDPHHRDDDIDGRLRVLADEADERERCLTNRTVRDALADRISTWVEEDAGIYDYADALIMDAYRAGFVFVTRSEAEEISDAERVAEARAERAEAERDTLRAAIKALINTAWPDLLAAMNHVLGAARLDREALTIALGSKFPTVAEVEADADRAALTEGAPDA